MTIPRIEAKLPGLAAFIAQLAQQRQDGALTDWQGFKQQVQNFYTPAMMQTIEQIVPGWGAMAHYADQQTLIHVTSVLTALRLLPEYQQATPDQQSLMLWMVLFHDVAKVAQRNKHDYVHGFRSAAVAGRGLARAGFPVTAVYPDQIDAWAALTHNAIIYRDGIEDPIQDNRKLPEIIAGIDVLFGPHAPAGAVIKAVLLHLSIVTEPDYPIMAPLTDDEIQQYMDADVWSLLRVMLLVDMNGWNLFDVPVQQRYRSLTIQAFDRIGRLIGLSDDPAWLVNP